MTADPATGSGTDGQIAAALALARAGDGFAAHELLEDLWRAAPAAERDFLQGLVHAVVAVYQDARANEVGRRRQLEKALKRLSDYPGEHRGVDLAAVRAWAAASLESERCAPFPDCC